MFLIFTVSKTFHFQGMAVMTSKSSNKTSYHWKSNEMIRLGGSFKVKWISNFLLSLNRVANLTNSYSDNEPIKKCRDCTELDPIVGKEICSMFEIPFRNPSLPNSIEKILNENKLSINQDILSQNLTKA